MNLKKILEGLGVEEELVGCIDLFVDLDDYNKLYSVDYLDNGFYNSINIHFKLKEDVYLNSSNLKVLIPHDKEENYEVSFSLRDTISNVGKVDDEKQEMYYVDRNLVFEFDRKAKVVRKYSLQQSLRNVYDNSALIVHNQNNYNATIIRFGQIRSYDEQWINAFVDKEVLELTKTVKDKNRRDILFGEQNFINLIKESKLFNKFNFYDETPLTKKLHQ